jgi:geranylgeranyl pyrophosphate synthase
VKTAHLIEPAPIALLEMLESSRATVPARLWEPALLEPLRDFLSRPGKGSRSRLVELAFCLAGGTPGGHPAELPLLIESLHAGSLIIDDIEDGSEMRRGAPTLHRRYGVPVALNAGNWLYFHAHDLLCRMALPDHARLLAFQQMTRCLLRCHEGQALDLTTRVMDLARHEIAPFASTVASLKTGGLLSLGMALAAIAADAPAQTRESLAAFGSAVGTAIQMFDDLSGVINPRRRAKAIEDLRHARPTFVWAWLAEDASDELYRASQSRLRAVMDGEDPNELLESLRFRVAKNGSARARGQLRDAMMALQEDVRDRPMLDALERQLAKLEPLYFDSNV